MSMLPDENMFFNNPVFRGFCYATNRFFRDIYDPLKRQSIANWQAKHPSKDEMKEVGSIHNSEF